MLLDLLELTFWNTRFILDDPLVLTAMSMFMRHHKSLQELSVPIPRFRGSKFYAIHNIIVILSIDDSYQFLNDEHSISLIIIYTMTDSFVLLKMPVCHKGL